jgi:Protein of unknown function (DUF2585)
MPPTGAVRIDRDIEASEPGGCPFLDRREGAEKSRHFADWYSLSPYPTALYFSRYSLISLQPSRWQARATIAIAIEALREVVENSDYVIELYRAQTISLNYFGDTIIPSIGDILYTAFGFAKDAPITLDLSAERWARRISAT